MSAAHPFAFEREFGGGFPLHDARALSDELERLQRESAGAAAEVRREAEAAALARLQAERDTALLEACEALREAVDRLEERHATSERELAADAAGLALEAADLLAGAALERTPSLAIEQAIDRALEDLRRGTPLEVRVHPDLVAPLEAAMQQRQQRDRRRLHVTVVADDQLAPGDARLRWERGEARLDREARREALARELAELLTH